MESLHDWMQRLNIILSVSLCVHFSVTGSWLFPPADEFPPCGFGGYSGESASMITDRFKFTSSNLSKSKLLSPKARSQIPEESD